MCGQMYRRRRDIRRATERAARAAQEGATVSDQI
jgi:Flp pilus assembly protein TadG